MNEPRLNIHGQPIPDMSKLVLKGTSVEREREPGIYDLVDRYYEYEDGTIYPEEYFIISEEEIHIAQIAKSGFDFSVLAVVTPQGDKCPYCMKAELEWHDKAPTQQQHN